jgi:hypothetical protein
MLEVQTLDKLGWFTDREISPHFDEVQVQTLLDLVQQIQPCSLLPNVQHETFYKALPPSIRSFIRSHAVISKWATAKIAEAGIGGRREARMNLFLSALEVCRPRPDATHPCVRSFVEAALTAAILSPESRAFHRAWYNVARTRSCSLDSLASFLSVQTTKQQVSDLRPDVGWILERMLEVISLPDTIESNQGGLSLVNFSKRRHLCDLVQSTPAKLQQADYDRLNNMYNQVSKMDLDLRTIQHEAARENGQWIQTQKRAPKPFQKLVLAQVEKTRRDRLFKERLVREKRAELLRQEQRQNDLNRAMQPKKTPSRAQKEQRNKRTMSSAFFRVMRPISTAFSSDNLHSPVHRLTASDLDFQPTHKPSATISLVDAKVAPYSSPDRPNTFQLDTEDGGQYLLQTPSKAEMSQWVTLISNIAQSSASKRLTYLSDFKPQLADLLERPRTMTRHPVAGTLSVLAPLVLDF